MGTVRVIDTFVALLDKIRLAGYFNEAAGAIQASFWPEAGKQWDTTAFWTLQPPTWFKGLCAVTWLYALGAIAGKTVQTYQQAEETSMSPATEALKAFGKEAIFQGIATVVVPTYAIHAVQNAAQWGTQRIAPAFAQSKTMPWARLLVGIAAMPVAAKVIDGATHAILAHTYDRAFSPLPTHANSATSPIYGTKKRLNHVSLSSETPVRATHLQAAGYHHTVQRANARFDLYSQSSRHDFGMRA